MREGHDATQEPATDRPDDSVPGPDRADDLGQRRHGFDWDSQYPDFPTAGESLPGFEDGASPTAGESLPGFEDGDSPVRKNDEDL